MNSSGRTDHQPSTPLSPIHERQVTEQPRETHLETHQNEVVWAPLPDREQASGTDNIPGSPGYNGPVTSRSEHRAGTQRGETQKDERGGVNVASHDLSEVPEAGKGSMEEGYLSVDPQQQG